METSLVYQNESSKGKMFAALFIPAIFLIAYLLFIWNFNVEKMLVLAAIPYIFLWLMAYQFLLFRVFEVMVIFKDRIMFVNPYRTKVLPLHVIGSIYYRSNHGISFHDTMGKVYRPHFKLEMEDHDLEAAFSIISAFIVFSEEHLRDSHTYCLVNNKIGKR
ncbi:MAG: hypothetical protein U9R75_05360 [Candidatus Thermoplasmatota archaeon]|nr:hypothetical protein [Candidatus Thermoplasmatota archaeon]